MQGMEWKQSNLSDDLRQIVYNNKLNGQDLVISPSRPELSVTPDEQQLQAFKYNGNIIYITCLTAQAMKSGTH